MVDNSSIKPVVGPGNISQLTPAKRREQRKKQNGKNKNIKNQKVGDYSEPEENAEEDTKEKYDENNDALGIDFRA